MEQWNELCYLLSDSLPSNTSEQIFELKVIQGLEKLGWSQYKNEIVVRESIRIGAANKISPDIVVKSGLKNLFVVEVKKPLADLSSKTFQDQLSSYMRLMRLNYGILIGSSIKIFAEGSFSGEDRVELIEDIPFEKDNERGLNFINLFKKGSFTVEKIEEYISRKIKVLKEKNDINLLKNEITSKDYEYFLKERLKDKLLNDYSIDIVENVLKDVKVTISRNQFDQPESIKRALPESYRAGENDLKYSKSLGIKPTRTYDLNNPPNLSFTKVIIGEIEGAQSKNWNDLLRLILRQLFKKGISKTDLKQISGLNIEYGNINDRGFNHIAGTDYSLQNVDANKAGRALLLIAKEYKVSVKVEFKWKNHSGAAFPNETCILRS